MTYSICIAAHCETRVSLPSYGICQLWIFISQCLLELKGIKWLNMQELTDLMLISCGIPRDQLLSATWSLTAIPRSMFLTHTSCRAICCLITVRIWYCAWYLQPRSQPMGDKHLCYFCEFQITISFNLSSPTQNSCQFSEKWESQRVSKR